MISPNHYHLATIYLTKDVKCDSISNSDSAEVNKVEMDVFFQINTVVGVQNYGWTIG